MLISTPSEISFQSRIFHWLFFFFNSFLFSAEISYLFIPYIHISFYIREHVTIGSFKGTGCSFHHLCHISSSESHFSTSLHVLSFCVAHCEYPIVESMDLCFLLKTVEFCGNGQ